MRYLNKIVFINSAHIPYAEVRLDGNVHFIGNQGAGKSTLLRAILFFYNVDKSKLGIKTQFGQKSFDDFYLPTQDSFIIYEVCRETGDFFVMAFLSRGRLAFRIVDCPYQKHFFVDNDGNVSYEWGKISEQIGAKTFKSSIIRGYQEFSDILYGNIQNVAKELRRFSLMESTRYRQVPLTIQNIFLNQSLESRVIKDTIIDSMDFAGDCISLNRYREEVKNFRQQYDDIWKWYKIEKNGQVKVKVEAEKAIEKFTQYEYTRNMIKELCGHLKYALNRDTNRLPQLSDQEDDCSTELARQNRLLEEEQGKYNSERDRLNKEDGSLKGFLEQVGKKKRHYDEIGIKQIAEIMSKEDELKTQHKSLSHQEATLTSKSQDVKSRYDALQDEEDRRKRDYENLAKEQITSLDQERLKALEELRSQRDKKLDDIRADYQAKLDDNQVRLDETGQIKHGLRLDEQNIRHANPYQEEIDQYGQQIDALRQRQQLLLQKSAQMQQEIDTINHDIEMSQLNLEKTCGNEVSTIDNNMSRLKDEIQRCEDLLSRQEGSLIEWLGEHVDGWEHTIGKMLDEDAVLYNTSLNPRLVDSSDTICGIGLDIENIDKDIRTPKDIKMLKNQLEAQHSELEEQKKKRQLLLLSEIEELEQKHAARLKQLRQEKMASDVERENIPRRIDKINKDLSEANSRLKEWRKSESEKLQHRLGEIERSIENLIHQKKSLTSSREKNLEAERKAFAKRENELASDHKRKSAEIKQQLAGKLQAIDRHKKDLLAQMDAELKGQGVDVDQLTAIRQQLDAVMDQLKYIEEHRPDFISWQNDIREYFNLEQQKRDERRLIRQQIENLKEKFDKRRVHYEEKIKGLAKDLNSLREEQHRLQDAIKRTTDFMSNSSSPAELNTVDQEETIASLADILDDLRNHVSDRQQKMEEFKQAVIRFKNNFSQQNTFHFRVEFNTDSDYTDFAIELNEFIQNNKIEQYRVRTSQQYATIIKRIAHDVSDLSQHKSDIEKTILDINRDFRENNFAGVIKDIELRAVESNDRLMQQMLNIKRFDDEHGFNIGQLNLFTNEVDLDRTNEKAVKLLMTLVDMMDAEQKREQITLSDTFKLEFKVKENDNDTNWVEKLSNVGSDGTDILVKAMVNIMLINVFKQKISRKFGDFKLHCMMDEIGKLHPINVEGILKFANVRNIYLINSSPTAYNANPYRYTYMLTKDDKSNTKIDRILTIL